MSSLSTVSHLLARIPFRVVAYITAILLVPLLAGSFNLGAKAGAVRSSTALPIITGTLPEPPTYDPSKLTAVILSSDRGAEITDFLPTYDILARSGRFNVYTVAPERQVLPLVNSNLNPSGLDFVPHFSFAGYDAAIGRAPDIIAVPYFPAYDATRDAAVLRWIRNHAGPDTTLLGICAGTEIVADTGLAAGHTATTNTYWFARLQKTHPEVQWLRNVRYVDDGSIIMSTNLAAGMDATLHAVDRFAGRDTALEVARQIDYPGTRYLDDPRWQPADSNGQTIGSLMFNAAYRSGPEDVALPLQNGVGELSLASIADPFTTSLAARIHTFAPEGAPIVSQHGLVFVPKSESAPNMARIVTPASSGWPYKASLAELGRMQGGATATDTAHILFVAASANDRAGAGLSIVPAFGVLILAALGAGLVYAIDTMLRRRSAATKSHLQARAHAGLPS